MLKKIKPIFMATLVMGFMGSCVTLNHSAYVTNNAVGSKTGVSKATSWDANQGVTFNDAMKDGRITKVGIAEYKMKNLIIMIKEEMTVTGE